jgi:hypothetical protein
MKPSIGTRKVDAPMKQKNQTGKHKQYGTSQLFLNNTTAPQGNQTGVQIQ